MKKKLLLVSSLVILNASDINVNLTNYTLETNLKLDIPKNFSIRGDFIYNDRKNKNNYASAGFQANGLIYGDNTKLKLFVDYVYTKNNSALPIGLGFFNDSFGEFKYPLFANVEVEYAPTVLSFRDATKFLYSRVEFGMIPIINAKLLVGYRIIRFNENYDTNFYAGIGFKF